MKSSFGDVEIAVPRDRNSEFVPQIVKRQHYMSLTILQRNGIQNTPKISILWRNHWAELSTYFKYPKSVRTLIYTTNYIENFNSHLRKVTKSKAVFPNDDSLIKILYLAIIDITAYFR